MGWDEEKKWEKGRGEGEGEMGSSKAGWGHGAAQRRERGGTGQLKKPQSRALPIAPPTAGHRPRVSRTDLDSLAFEYLCSLLPCLQNAESNCFPLSATKDFLFQRQH